MLVVNKQICQKNFDYFLQAKYQYLVKRYSKNGIKSLKDPNSLTEYSKNMQDIYKNIVESNQSRQCNVLIAFDDMIADMLSNKKLNQIVTELFITKQKIKYIYCFYYTTLSYCTKKYQVKFCTLFYYETSKQMRASTKYIQSFVRY